MSIFNDDNGILQYHYDAEEVWIEPWGKNSLRIRATKNPKFIEENWALQMKVRKTAPVIDIGEDEASIINGKIKAVITRYGKITFFHAKTGKILLDEYLRNRKDKTVDYCSALNIDAREFKANPGGDYHLSMRFVSTPDEKIYGMGQYQQPFLNQKGMN